MQQHAAGANLQAVKTAGFAYGDESELAPPSQTEVRMARSGRFPRKTGVYRACPPHMQLIQDDRNDSHPASRIRHCRPVLEGADCAQHAR